MNIDPTKPISIPMAIQQAEPTKWIKVWHELPRVNSICPVWDGDFIYYAVYQEVDKKQLWVVSEQVGVNMDDTYLRKKHGEQVYPTHWMKINQPID